MGIKIGADVIQALYIGERKIVKAYAGETLVFAAGKPSRLPAGYTEVEYTQLGPNNASLYNFSAASCLTDQTIELDVEIITFPTSDATLHSDRPCLLYSYAVSGNTQYVRNALWLSKKGVYAGVSTGTIAPKGIQLSSDLTVPQRASILWDGPNKCVSINGGTPVAFPAYGVGSSWLIGSTSAGTASNNCWRAACARIYSLKITSDGNTGGSYNKNYVPAKDSAGRAGFYDLFNSKFIYHASLIAGPVV